MDKEDNSVKGKDGPPPTKKAKKGSNPVPPPEEATITSSAEILADQNTVSGTIPVPESPVKTGGTSDFLQQFSPGKEVDFLLKNSGRLEARTTEMKVFTLCIMDKDENLAPVALVFKPGKTIALDPNKPVLNSQKEREKEQIRENSTSNFLRGVDWKRVTYQGEEKIVWLHKARGDFNTAGLYVTSFESDSFWRFIGGHPQYREIITPTGLNNVFIIRAGEAVFKIQNEDGNITTNEDGITSGSITEMFICLMKNLFDILPKIKFGNIDKETNEIGYTYRLTHEKIVMPADIYQSVYAEMTQKIKQNQEEFAKKKRKEKEEKEQKEKQRTSFL
jgi:hypothetical protein